MGEPAALREVHRTGCLVVRACPVRACLCQGADAIAVLTEPSTEALAAPYRGIRPFRYIDQPIFLAREQETQRLESLVVVYRGVMLYGDSGSGKSSLMNAGLIPRLLELEFQPERIRVQPRPGEEIVVERIAASERPADFLPSALVPAGDTASHAVFSVNAFAARVTEVAPDSHPILLFDQFEELVTLFDEVNAHDAQKRLVTMLTKLLLGDVPAKVVLCFRDDYLGKIKELLAAYPDLIDQSLRIAPPSADALPTIISGPFMRAEFKRRLPDELIGQLVLVLCDRFRTGDVSLSEVQTVCLRLWQSDDPQKLLTEKGVRGILEDYLGEALDALPPELKPAAIDLLNQMVTSAGTRNVISKDDLFQRVREDGESFSDAFLDEALEHLADSRLVRREQRRDLQLYEITSEFLVPWISRQREKFQRQQDRERERRRFLILAAIAVALLIVVAVVAFFAVQAAHERSHAQAEARTATAFALAAAGQASSASRPEVGLSLSLAALQSSGDGSSAFVEAQNTLIESLQSARAAGLRAILHGGSGTVWSVAFNPVTRLLASASSDGTVRIWDPATAAEVTPPLTAKKSGSFDSVAFSSPDGALLAAGSDDGYVRLWNGTTFRALGPALRRQQAAVVSVAFSHNGHFLASASLDGSVILRNLHENAAAMLRPTSGRMYGVAFTPDDRFVASVSDDSVVRIWQTANPRAAPLTLNSPGSSLYALAFSPNGRYFAAAGSDEKIWIWDLATRRPKTTLTGDTDTIDALAFSPDGKILASGSVDRTVRLWNVRTGRLLGSVRHAPAAIDTVAFAPDGRTVVSGSYDSTLRVWSTAPTSSGNHVLYDPGGQVFSVAFNPVEPVLAAGSDDGRVRLWDSSTNRALGALPGVAGGAVNAVAFAPDGHTLFAGADDGVVREWNVRGRTLPPITVDTSGISSLGLSRDGRMLAAGSYDGWIWLLERSTIRVIARLDARAGGQVRSVEFAPDGRTLVAGTSGGRIFAWSIRTRKRLATRALSGGPVLSVVVASDGRQLASGSGDGVIRMWSLPGLEPLQPPLVGHTQAVNSLAFSPDGRYLVSGSSDTTARMWSAVTHEPFGPLLGRQLYAVDSVAYSRDGLVAAGGDDGSIRLTPAFRWPGLDSVRRQVCSLVPIDLTRVEWLEFARGVPYRHVCQP